GYSRGCFQIRNEWMVDRSARVIAVYNGEAGGTRNTIAYANKVGILCREQFVANTTKSYENH
ncbi:MAG: hypothetical protein SPK32_11530, partial [Bacteroidaceae bacterium]|nr:hypothetical protein [Bacteroidaceae bacterium]